MVMCRTRFCGSATGASCPELIKPMGGEIIMSKIVANSFAELPFDSRKRLIPKPHIIKAMRARNWNLEGAIEELVDNSIGHGRATEVIIDIDSANYIKVIDNGIGVKNINSIFH
jgi:hypothetical protein